jgi:5-(carboxyamino)imidazole ribonucleotide synthase
MKQRLGIVGGGQLGRMLAFEAKKLGFVVTVLDPTFNGPAAQVADNHIQAAYDNAEALKKLAEESDFITFEIELADAKLLEDLTHHGAVVQPSAITLGIIRDKLHQKEFLATHHLPVAPFFPIRTTKDVLAAAKQHGYPLVVKARVGGYDGRGNVVVKAAKDIEPALAHLQGRELYGEAYIPFTKELSVVVARNMQGEIAVYPVVETVHTDNICHTVHAPAHISAELQQKAEKLAAAVMEHLKGAGVFGIEMFLTKEGNVIVNEIAPRVHNSGHHTIEACATSQFEQHVRAVVGLPLGSTAMVVPAAVMINILGEQNGPAQLEGLEKALAIPQVYVHIYGKQETRQARKMGHITALDTTAEGAHKKAVQARNHITI